MAISTFCVGCRSLLRLPDELAGKHVRCQQCNQLFMVPGVLAGRAASRSLPRPDPAPDMALPAGPQPAPPAPADVPPVGGLPSLVPVEVPVRPTPPPVPAEGDAARKAPPEPSAAPRHRPMRDLSSRTKPRRPTSNRGCLTLTAMIVLFVGLLGAGVATWIWARVSAPRPGLPAMGQKPVQIVKGGGVQELDAQQALKPINGAQGAGLRFDPGPPGPKFNDNLATRIALKRGYFSISTTLNNNDPLDPVPRWPAGEPLLPCKVFLIELKKDTKYLIEYRREVRNNQAFDPYLRLEGLEGKRLIENDDIAQDVDRDSRIEFTPAKTETFRIFCTLFHRVLPAGDRGAFRLTIREDGVEALSPVVNFPLPQPMVTNRPLLPQLATQRDLTVHTLANPPGHITLPRGDVCWSADGKAFFVLYHTGTLLRVRVDGFVEERRLELRRPSGEMAMSAEGLVVTVPNANEVWLIGTDDLQVKKRFGTGTQPLAIAAAPSLRYAYVARPRPGNAAHRGILVLDLANDETARFADFPNGVPAVAPDGAYLFTLDGGMLLSFQIKEDGRLVEKQSSEQAGFNPANARRINISPDSRYVGVTGVKKNVDVYPVDDLRKRAFEIGTGWALNAVGFDLQADRVFAYEAAKAGKGGVVSLRVFDGAGRSRGEYGLGVPQMGINQSIMPLQYLTHADGNKLLIRFPNKLCYAIFKADSKLPLAKLDPNLPTPVAIKDAESFARPPFKLKDMTYRELELPNLDSIDPCWDADGQALFHLEPEGTLYRVRARDFVPELRLPLGKPVAAMTITVNGLLIALRDQPTLFLIDAVTLQIKQQLKLPTPARYLAGHPRQTLAAAVGAEVTVVELARGSKLRLPAPADPGVSFHHAALAPDGNYLFLAQSGAGSSKVLRVRIADDRLVVEDMRDTPVKAPHAFCVTNDGQQVAWYRPQLGNKTAETVFHKTADWQPEFTLPVKTRAIACAADGTLYVHTIDNETLLFDRPKNRKAAPATLPWPAGRIREFMPHPVEPRAFLASTGNTVYYGEPIAAKPVPALAGAEVLPRMANAKNRGPLTDNDAGIRVKPESSPDRIEPAFDHPVGLVYHFDWFDMEQRMRANVWWSQFTPDGSAFLVGGDAGPKGVIRLWDVATGKLLQEFATGGDPWFNGGLFLPDGKQILTWYSRERDLFLWDVATAKLVRKFAGPASYPLSVAVAPDGKRCLAGGNDNVLCIYDLNTGKEVAKLVGHADKCYGVFSPDSQQVLSYGPDRTLRLWDVANGKLLHKLDGHTAACTGVFSPDGKQVLSYSADKTVRLWDAATGKAIRSFAGSTDEVTSALFVPGGEKIVAWGKDWTVRVWAVGSGKILHQFVLGDKFGASPHMALTPDGRRLLLAGANDTVLVLELATGKEIQRFHNAVGRQGFSFSPDGRYAAAGSFRAGVYLWRLPAP